MDYWTLNQWSATANAATVTVVWFDAAGDLNFQSIDGDGNLLWPGRPVPANAYQLEAACDEDGNTWVMWVDASTKGIYLQVISETGMAVWGQARTLREGRQPGTQVSGTSMWLMEHRPGRFTAAWSDWGVNSPVEMRDVSIDEETPMAVVGRYSAGHDSAALLGQVSDGRGGLFAFWSTEGSILAQLIDSGGKRVWPENGLVVVDGVGAGGTETAHALGSDGAGGAVVCWEVETADGVARRAQRIDSVGSRLWPDSGIAIDTLSEPAAWSIGASDQAVFFASGTRTNHESHLQKVDMDGSLPWGPEGIRLDDWRESGAG